MSNSKNEAQESEENKMMERETEWEKDMDTYNLQRKKRQTGGTKMFYMRGCAREAIFGENVN